jgi:hypothetical protein
VRQRDSRAPRAIVRRRRLLLGLACATVAVVLVVVLTSGGTAGPPLPGIGKPAKAGDPFAYVPGRQSDFVTRATAGTATVVFQKSPGGVIATAARVASFRKTINRVTRGTRIDPALLEGIVFLESAGRPNVIAGADVMAAAGLTQILAPTGTSLLAMHIDLAKSRAYTAQIDAAYRNGQTGNIAKLQAKRAKIDDRFNPAKALAATVRYLKIAEHDLGGRQDLAIVSYHMGIGNLQHVLSDYDGGSPVPYAQLYFDTAPDHDPQAFNLLQGFGDDSSLYYWRVLASVQIMRLYRTDRAALRRLAALETATPSTADVLHPPDRTESFADPGALSDAYQARSLLPLPKNAAQLGLTYDSVIGAIAGKFGAPAALYRGLRPAALDMLIELATRVRVLSSSQKATLTLASTVVDRTYQQQAQLRDPGATTGWSFQFERRYASTKQALAFQAMLDRLQALDLIAWSREPATIDVTVASDAAQVIVNGP